MLLPHVLHISIVFFLYINLFHYCGSTWFESQHEVYILQLKYNVLFVIQFKGWLCCCNKTVKLSFKHVKHKKIPIIFHMPFFFKQIMLIFGTLLFSARKCIVTSNDQTHTDACNFDGPKRGTIS